MENNNHLSTQRSLSDPQKTVVRPDILLAGFVLLIAGLTGIAPPVLQAICIFAACAMFLFTDGIYLVYAIMLFYENALGTVFGISIYRIFSLAYLVITVLRCGTIKFQYRQLLVLCLLALHCIATLAEENFSRALFPAIDMLCIILLINCYLQDHENLRLFFTFYTITALIAYFTGFQTEAVVSHELINGEYVEIYRNSATFEDPNYMSFFYTVAVFATAAFKLFHKALRILIIIALYAIMLTSVSVTAVLVNIALWLVYLLITKSVSPKGIALILIGLVLIFGLYQYGVKNPEDPVLGAVVMRVSEKIDQAQSGDMTSATTLRSDLQKQHWEYFMEQPFLKQLVGLNAASALKMDLPGIKGLAHNEYIDWLLNVGVIGTIIMFYYLIRSTASAAIAYVKDKTDSQALGITMLKGTWILYGLALTFFGDFRFVLFFLL